jgi:hypothetical protein
MSKVAIEYNHTSNHSQVHKKQVYLKNIITPHAKVGKKGISFNPKGCKISLLLELVRTGLLPSVEFTLESIRNFECAPKQTLKYIRKFALDNPVLNAQESPCHH